MSGVHRMDCAVVVLRDSVFGDEANPDECDCGANAELLTIATGLGGVAGRAETGEPVDPNRLVGYAQRLEHLVTGGRPMMRREKKGDAGA